MSLAETALLLLLLWLSYRLTIFFTKESPFSNIPGPPSSSWLTGTLPNHIFLSISHIVLLGNMVEYMDRHGWAFHDKLIEYGRVCALNGLFGVSLRFRLSTSTQPFNISLQAKTLFVFDPKAMYNIFVREQDIYEENRWVITYGYNLALS